MMLGHWPGTVALMKPDRGLAAYLEIHQPAAELSAAMWKGLWKRMEMLNEPAVKLVCELLKSEDWLERSAIVAHNLALAEPARGILRTEARDALARGDDDDAFLFAAVISLLDDIEQRGLGPVQAEIICAQARQTKLPE